MSVLLSACGTKTTVTLADRLVNHSKCRASILIVVFMIGAILIDWPQLRSCSSLTISACRCVIRRRKHKSQRRHARVAIIPVARHTTINVRDPTRVDLAVLCQWLPTAGDGLGKIEAFRLACMATGTALAGVQVHGSSTAERRGGRDECHNISPRKERRDD